MTSDFFVLQNQYNQVIVIFTPNIYNRIKIPESIISMVKFSKILNCASVFW